MTTKNSTKWLSGLFIFGFLLTPTFMKAQTDKIEERVLNPREQCIVIISGLTAKGDLETLSTELGNGLDVGLAVEETKEILVQLYAYCGFPRSLNAINTLMTVIEKRKANGIIDKQGRQFASKNGSQDNYERGRKVLETLTKMPQSKPAPGFGEFAPRIDAFLKEHLFADIFESEVLTFRERELVTISALSAMSGVRPQLQSHIQMGMNTGITNNQLTEVSKLIEKFVSRSQANSLKEIIGEHQTSIIEPDMMVRISKIEILPAFLTEYNAILKEEAAASLEKEAGVIAIFPMNMKEQPTQIRIIEIYADSSAYQAHLKTPHFQNYKTSTLKMVKSLKLVDMNTLDQQTMLEIFKKLK